MEKVLKLMNEVILIEVVQKGVRVIEIKLLRQFCRSKLRIFATR